MSEEDRKRNTNIEERQTGRKKYRKQDKTTTNIQHI